MAGGQASSLQKNVWFVGAATSCARFIPYQAYPVIYIPVPIRVIITRSSAIH